MNEDNKTYDISVQNCLGHVSPLVTLGTYAHAFNKANARATEAISSTISLINTKQTPTA